MQKPLTNYLPLLHHTKIRQTLGRKPPAAVWAYEESVFSTWEVYFLEIQENNPMAAELLTLCSFLSNAEIQTEMFERGLKIVDPEGMIRRGVYGQLANKFVIQLLRLMTK